MRRLTTFALSVGLFLSCCTASRAQRSFDDGVDQYLRERAENDHFSGSVLLARNGKVLFQHGYGLGNREWNAANTPETRFRIASVTKQFTAAAILLLQEKRQLSVHEKASRYLPSLPAAWSEVTVHQLLVHTSGIPNYTDAAEEAKLDRLGATPQDLLNLVKDRRLEFPAGMKRLYSNTNYLLLGMIIESVSGLSYADFLQKFLLEPLGLHDTGLDRPEPILPQRAAPYRWLSGEWLNAQQVAASVPYSAGGLYSTVRDLFVWEEALQNGRILSPASRVAMFTAYPETVDGSQSEGYGVIIASDFDQPVWIATGNITGFASAVLYYPQTKVLSIVLTNVDKAGAVPIASDLAGMLIKH